MSHQRVAWRDQNTLSAQHFLQLEAWTEGLVQPLAQLQGFGLLRVPSDKTINLLPILGPPSEWMTESDGREAICELKPIRALTPSGRLLTVPKRMSLPVKFTHKQLEQVQDGTSVIPVYLITTSHLDELTPMQLYDPPVALVTHTTKAALDDALQVAEFKVRGKEGLVLTDPFIPECVHLGSCDGLATAAEYTKAAAETCRRLAIKRVAAIGRLGTVSGENILRLEALRAAGTVCQIITLILDDPKQSARAFIRLSSALANQTQETLSELGFAIEGFARGIRTLRSLGNSPNLSLFFDQLRNMFNNLLALVEGIHLEGPQVKPRADIEHQAGSIQPVGRTRWRQVKIPLLEPLRSSVSSGERVSVQWKTTRPAQDVHDEEIRVHPVAEPGEKDEDNRLRAHRCKLRVRGTTASFQYTPGDSDLDEAYVVFYVGEAVARILTHVKNGLLPANAVRIRRR